MEIDALSTREKLIETTGLTGGRVLDVGMGGCACMSRLLVRHGFDVVGVDRSAQAVHEARIEGQGQFEARRADAEHLPFAEAEFDAVVAYHTLHHADDAEQVLALDPYYTTMPNLKRIFPWARKRGMINGKTWGVPHEVEFIPVFYNKRVFDELGIRQLPSSYDQLLTLCKTIKAAGAQPLTVATGRASPGHLYSAILMAVIGKDGTEEILYRNGRWDGEGPTRAAQLIVDLQNLEYLPKDPYDPQWNAGNDFPSGKVAMWPNGTWSLATYERNKQQFLGFDYGYFPFPLVNPNIKLTVAGGIGGGFSVNSKTKNVEASIAWIDHLMSPAAQKLWVEILIQVSPTPFKPEDYQVPEGVRAALRTIATGEEMGYNISVVSPAKFVDEYWDGLKAILQGRMQPKEWTARLQQQWEIAKNEGRVLKP